MPCRWRSDPPGSGRGTGDALPLEVVKGGPLKFVSVKYHREIPLGSQVEVFYAPSADGWYVVGRREEHAAFECYLEFTK